MSDNLVNFESLIKPKEVSFESLIKKKESTPSGFSVTPLPSQDKFQQGLAMAQSPIASAVKKDTQKDNNWFAGMYNNFVKPVSSLAGGSAYLAEAVLGGRPEAMVTRLASAREFQKSTESFFDKLRSEKSSKEYEQEQAKEFDVTPVQKENQMSREDAFALTMIDPEKLTPIQLKKYNEILIKNKGKEKPSSIFSGVDAKDVKSMAFQTPGQLLSFIMGAYTAGSTYIPQSISDASNEIYETDKGNKLNDGQKAAYIFTQAAAQYALEKVSLDLILKNTGLGKAAKQKIANEIVDKFVAKGVKATAEDVEKEAIRLASSMASKAKRIGIKAATGVLAEPGTEALQTGASEGVKLLTNKISKTDVFNEEDIIANLGKNMINSAVMATGPGAIGGGFVGAFQNTKKAIREEIANEKDVNTIQSEINKQVEEGNITPEEAQAANITAKQYADIASKIPTTVSPQDKYKIIGGIEQREALNIKKQQAYEELTDLDPVFKKEKQDQIDLIQAKIDETNDYLEGIVSGKKPEYKEKRGMYFKVDSEGNETPINKETYDLATSIRDEDKVKEKQQFDQFVNRIVEGERMETPEDLQFYENNKTEIEKALKTKAEETKPAVVMPEENIAPQVVEPSKGAAVIMPQENVPAETTVIRPEQQGKGAAVIMPKANVAPEFAETVVTEEVAPTEVKPEVKSKLDAFKTKFAPQPKEVSVSGVTAAQKRVNRQEAAKIAPTDARGFALSWMNQSPDALDWNSIKDLFGGRRARLNVKEVTPEEIAKRDYVAEKEGDEKVGKNGLVKGIDEVVGDIWNNLPEGLEDRITTRDIKDELEALISEYPTRADAARALIQHEGGLKGKSMEEQQLAFEERKGIEEGEEMAPVELEGGFVPFEEDMDIEGMEEPPFAVQEATTEEVAAMQDIVKDYIDDGTTSLSEIKKAIAKELGYNTKKLRQTIEDAYNEYTKTQEAAPKDVVGGVVGRIGNALKKMFGKDAQKPFIAKDGKAMQAKLDEIREDVKFQIAGGFRSTNDMPIAYRYDTDQVARERYDIPKLKKIGEGSDRVVFDLKDGNVLKIAKTPRGLEQNIYEGDYYLAGSVLPDIIERGVNYIVVEKVDQAISRTIDLGIAEINIELDKKEIGKLNDLLKQLKQFTQKDFDNHDPELQQILEDNDLTDIMNYDVIWNDFTAKRNWGLKKGEPIHLDGGTFGGIQMLNRFKGQKPLSDPEFRDIYNKSKKSKIDNNDADKYTKFMATPDAEILGFTYNNRMYLNGSALNPNTPIHEAGHIWVEWTKTNDPKIYAKGMELVKDSPYYKKAKDSKFYQEQANNLPEDQREDYYSNEALAMAIGDKGAQFVVESKKDAFKDWLKTLWNKIKSLTGFKDLTEEQFQNLTFEEFSKMAVKEILGVENDLDKFQAVRSMKKKKDFVKGKVRGEANKRAIDDFDVEDMVKLIKADYDLQTLKNIRDAIQKRSAEEVLPSQPRKTREARGERKRVEPRVEGDETTGEGEDAQPEDVKEGDKKGWNGAITIAANEDRRLLLGLPEYESEKQSFEKWTDEAIRMLKKGYNVDKLLDRMQKGEVPTPVENQIRKIYVAKLKQDYLANPSAELEKKLIKYTQLNDIANSQAGRALRSLADVADPRETLADFVISKMEANNVDELTEKQRGQVKKQYEEVKKKEEDVEAKLEINDELNTQLLAENAFKEEKAKRKPYQKTKDYKADRKSIIESIKQKWKDKDKPSDVLMALPFPVPTKKAQQLIAIAPDVNKLMSSYIEEGVDDLKEIVSRIYVDLRNEIEGLSEKDIFDVIAGRYKKEKPLLSQLQFKKAELKKEAELIAKIEDIMAGNMPTSEKAKIEQNQKLTQLRNELRDLKKEVGFYDLSKINSLKEKNLEKIKELDEKIQKGDFEKAIRTPSFLENPEFKNKYPKEYDAYLQSVRELTDKKHEFEVSLAKDELKGLTFRQKLVKRWGPEFKNTLSAIKATADNSFIFIQLGPAIWQNPLLLPKVLNEQRKVIFNEGRFRKEIVQIFENKELANLIEVSGLDILDPQTLRESLREEQLGGTDFLERSVEIKGKKYSLATVIKAPFERIAIAAGNYVRLKLFLESVSHLEAQGKTIETHEKEFKDAARIANELTSRGEMSEEFKTGKLKTLSSLMWAPKMISSTLNLLGIGDAYNYALGRKGYYASLSPELRKAAIGKMATAITVPYLVMAAIALDDDFEVDYDPRSVTFGQLKQISTGKSWNPYGRFTSVVRYLILMMLGVRYIGDEKMRADFKTESFKFFRGKMAPAYGLGLDLAFREGFDGQPLSFNDVAKDAVTPLALKDLKTYMEDDGTWGLITQGLPAITGIKVGTEKQFNQAKQPLEDVIKKHARTDDTYYSFELKNPTTKEIATKEQFDKFVKERDRLIAEKLTDLYNGYVITDSPNPVPFVSLEANEASKQISTAKTESTKEAKEIVFGKKKKSAMERLIERKRRMLRR